MIYIGSDTQKIAWCESIGIGTTATYDKQQGVNAPKLTAGMIPVKYNEETKNWVKADKNNTNNDWYKYDELEKKWANVVTVKEKGINTRKYYMDAVEGTTIESQDITTMFVWIPRYSYSINEGYYKVGDDLAESASSSNGKVDVTFLVGTSNFSEQDEGIYKTYEIDYDSTTLKAGDETPKIVHPGFVFGGKQLTGIWVAKFEASGSTLTPTILSSYPGNGQSSADLVTITNNTYVTVLPTVPSWRNINLKDAQYQSMRMALDENNAYGLTTATADTHLMKNTEWGVVAYLSASKYGAIPIANRKATYNSTTEWYYDLLTGYVGDKNTYSTSNGVKGSTTHNIYGIYDINGGAGELVAAYLDNNYKTINTYLGEYLTDGILQPKYQKYWDVYGASEEERNDKIVVDDLGDGKTTTPKELLTTKAFKTINGVQVYTYAWNEARARITKANYDLMYAKKGDALYEIIDNYSYYGLINNGEEEEHPYRWFKINNTTNLATWNSDSIELGIGMLVFVVRGGAFSHSNASGAFRVKFHNGTAAYSAGFRPVCIAI